MLRNEVVPSADGESKEGGSWRWRAAVRVAIHAAEQPSLQDLHVLAFPKAPCVNLVS